jgi:glycosyltransferase involved in cell wall biosynthesis
MQILHVYKTALPESTGGVEQVIHQIAKGCVAHGISSDVLFTSRSKKLDSSNYAGYKIHKSKSMFELASSPFSASIFAQFRSLAKKADVIHYHFPWPMMDLLHLSLRSKKPAVITYHSDIIRQRFLLHLYSPLMRWMMGSADKIIATSENYFKSSEILGFFKYKVVVIPLGLSDAEYLMPVEYKIDGFRKQYGERFFLFIGVLRYYKGLHILLEAALSTDFPILIVGAGPTERELKRHAQLLGLKNIHFLGLLPDSDKVALLQSCYSVVFPSQMRSEAFGVTLLEGAMFGKPLISCEIGTGTSFVNLANETGVVIPPNDPVSLRHAMQYLWDHPEKASEMGKNARLRYERHFTGEQMVRSYVNLYKSVVD